MGLFNKRKEREFQYDVEREVQRVLGNRALAEEVVSEQVPLASAHSNNEFIGFLAHMDYSQWGGALKLLKFGNVDTQVLKWYLYHHGHVLLYRNEAGTVSMGLAIPSSWNDMNKVVGCRVLLPRSQGNVPTKEFILGVDSVLITDTLSREMSMLPPSRKSLVDWSIQLMSEIFARLKINIMLSGDKVWVRVPDPKVAKSVKHTIISAYKSYDPVVVINDVLATIEPKELHCDPRFAEIFGLLKQTDIWRQSIHGFGTGSYGIDKDERLITAEAEAGKDIPKYQMNARKELWEQTVQQLQIFRDVGFGEATILLGGDRICFSQT